MPGLLAAVLLGFCASVSWAHEVPSATAPVLDGQLDAEEWAGALRLPDLTQADPQPGAVPSEHTEVHVMRDDKALYVSVRAFDSEPAAVLARDLQRDSEFESDDLVQIVLDPSNRRQDGYSFAVNPLGARADGLVENGDDLLEEWDGIWTAAAQHDDAGWTAEIAIPFKTLAFDPANDIWAINVERVIRRKQERARLSGAARDREVLALSDALELRGFARLRQGRGVDVTPFLALKHNSGAAQDESLLQPGLDAVWRIRPQLAASLTVNTDFADADVDEREVNLTRFPLFFPEKRSFFLQDAAYFRFGGIDYSPYPFFSRRIGLTESGERVDLEAGAKLSGRAGPWTLGLLSVDVDESAEASDKQLSVLRVAREFGANSFGLIATEGEPRAEGSNRLIGFDANVLQAELFPGKRFEAHLWSQHTQSDLAGGNDDAFGFNLVYPNQPWEGYFYFGRYGERFDPGLGFVQRRGIQEVIPIVTRHWRPERWGLRSVRAGIGSFTTLDLSGNVATYRHTFPRLKLTTERGDLLEATLAQERDVLSRDFSVLPGLVIPPGGYSYTRFETTATLDPSRPLSAKLRARVGEFYNGHRDDYLAQLSWRPDHRVFVQTSYELRRLRLDAGARDVRISALRLDLSANPRLSWRNVLQHDSVSEQLGVNSRLRWTYNGVNDLFLVLNRGFDLSDERDAEGADTAFQELTAKLGFTLRY